MANITKPESYEVISYNFEFGSGVEDSNTHEGHKKVQIPQLERENMLIFCQWMNWRMGELISDKICR